MTGVYAFSTFVVVVAKLSGFARGILFAAFLGTSVELDAYNGMLVIAGAVVLIAADQFELLVSAESAVEHAKGTGLFRVYVCESVTIATAVGFGLGLLALLLMPLLVGLLVPAARSATDLRLVPLALMLLPVALLQVPSRVMAALLRGSGRAPLSILLDGLQGLSFLIFGGAALVVLSDSPNSTKVLGVALSQSVGLIGVVAIQFAILWRANGALPLQWDVWQPARSFAQRLAVISGLNGLSYGFTLIDRHFAAKIMAGGLSLVNYAGNISLTLRAALAYDHLYIIEFSKSRDRAKNYVRAIATCLWLTVPLCGMLPIFARDLVRLIFQRGQFTADMAAHTGGILAIYGGFTTAFLLWQLMFRILQLEDCLRSMYVIYIVALLVSLGVTPVAVSRLGLPGAVCGTVAGTLCLLAGGAWRLHRSGLRLLPVELLLRTAAIAGYSWIAAKSVRAWFGSPTGLHAIYAVCLAGALAYAPTAAWWWRQRNSPTPVPVT